MTATDETTASQDTTAQSSQQEQMDKTVMFKQTYGLYIVSSTIVGKDAPEKTYTGPRTAGCIINTATQVTSDPVRITIAVNNENQTCKVIKQAGHFALSILDQSADMLFIGRFGFRSSLDFNKFEGIQTATDMFGDLYTPEHSCAVMACDVEKVIDSGTHTLFLAQVHTAKHLSDEKPMTYDYYHRVLKGKTPPKASSYLAS